MSVPSPLPADHEAREREHTVVMRLVCDDCQINYEGEVTEGEPEECVFCQSHNVRREIA